MRYFRSWGATTRPWIVSLLFAGPFLTACATTPERGFLVGSWSRASGETENVALRFRREVHGRGSLAIQLGASGERFSGDYVRLDDTLEDARLKRIQEGFVSDHFEEPPVNLPGRPEWGSSLTLDGLRLHYDRHVLAVLTGDRGHHMRCRLKLVDAERGLPGGATGDCESSAGDRILLLEHRR